MVTTGHLHGLYALPDGLGIRPVGVEVQNRLLGVVEACADAVDLVPELEGQVQEGQQQAVPVLSLGPDLLPQLAQPRHTLLHGWRTDGPSGVRVTPLHSFSQYDIRITDSHTDQHSERNVSK